MSSLDLNPCLYQSLSPENLGLVTSVTVVFKLIAFWKMILHFYAFSRRFYIKWLTLDILHLKLNLNLKTLRYPECIFRIYIFLSVCVPWELNPQPFALLTQCSTTESQEHCSFQTDSILKHFVNDAHSTYFCQIVFRIWKERHYIFCRQRLKNTGGERLSFILPVCLKNQRPVSWGQRHRVKESTKQNNRTRLNNTWWQNATQRNAPN